MDQLRSEKFDLAIAYIYDTCPFHIIDYVNISSYVWMSSTILTEGMASLIGVPAPPSYVPGRCDKKVHIYSCLYQLV